MDIKGKIAEIVNKLKTDKDLMNKFNTNPGGVVKELTGMDLPEDQVNSIVAGIKAKLTTDKLGGLGKLFGR